MNVHELCQKHVVTIRRHEDLLHAAWLMRERNVGCLVVVEPAGILGGERPIGTLTDRDIVTKVLAGDSDPRNFSVEDVMTRNPITVWTTTAIEEALDRMRDAQVRRVPVVDDRGRLAGILALDDVIEHLQRRAPATITPIRREPPRLDQVVHP